MGEFKGEEVEREISRKEKGGEKEGGSSERKGRVRASREGRRRTEKKG